MLQLIERVNTGSSDSTCTLALEQRVKGRLRVQLDDGRDAGIFLDRGQVIRGGDLLATGDGVVVEIIAADELLSEVCVDDPTLMARLCYHLGNRHVSLDISPGRIRYAHDHVLDDMVRGLGADPVTVTAPFEPESGAYHEHSHDHEH